MDLLTRHLEQETILSTQNKDLAAQVTVCREDLHDINDYLLNELKVSNITHLFLEVFVLSSGSDLEESLLQSNRRHYTIVYRSRITGNIIYDIQTTWAKITGLFWNDRQYITWALQQLVILLIFWFCGLFSQIATCLCLKTQSFRSLFRWKYLCLSAHRHDIYYFTESCRGVTSNQGHKSRFDNTLWQHYLTTVGLTVHIDKVSAWSLSQAV